ncbi:unnamed protein product [Rhizoctonia solani]|uniref:Carboxylesterase type B domain-containing protein n=1 Tax=Rhizoctonia solani TaxID=456999 RepID=A0A8H2XPA0_9AGAM|nr:unnamed protein product [Rhizoctonia solani]
MNIWLLFSPPPRRDHLDSATKFGVKSWFYLLKESSLDYAPEYGVGHGGDFPFKFVMETLNTEHPNALPAAVELMEIIGYYWINFACNLDPNNRKAKRD